LTQIENVKGEVLENIKNISEMNIEELNNKIQTTILVAQKKCCPRLSEREEKLSLNTR